MFFRKSLVGKKIAPGPRDWRDSFVTCLTSITMRVCIPLTCDVYSQIPPHTVIQPAGKHVLCRENFGCCGKKVIVLLVYSPHPRKDSSYKIKTRTIRNSQPKNSMQTSTASSRQKKNRPNIIEMKTIFFTQIAGYSVVYPKPVHTEHFGILTRGLLFTWPGASIVWKSHSLIPDNQSADPIMQGNRKLTKLSCRHIQALGRKSLFCRF